MSTETIAEQVQRAPNPYKAAIARLIRRELINSEDHQGDKKIIHFEDGSFIAFAVSYAPVELGRL